MIMNRIVCVSERVMEIKEKGKDDEDSDDEAEDDGAKEDEVETAEEKAANEVNKKELEKLVDEDEESDEDDEEWDFDDELDENEVEFGDDKDEIQFLQETLTRLEKESPEVIPALLTGGENLLPRLTGVFDRNTILIEKAKKDLRDAVGVVDSMLKNTTGLGLQEQCTNWVNNIQQQSATHLQHNINN